jgi:parallel beta-helix repeat protein
VTPRRSTILRALDACSNGGRGIRARRALRVCVLLPVLVLATAAEAGAATLYVDQSNPACSSTAPGTLSAPYCKIGSAASKATGGTTVRVFGGIYNERVSPRSGLSGSPVVFEAAAGHTVTVTGGSNGFYLSGKSWVTIRGFNIVDTDDEGVRVSSGSNNIKLIDNTVRFAGEPVSGQTAKGITVSESTDTLVEGNTVERNSNFGIYLVDSTRVKVVENSLAFNAKQYSRAASGIRLHGSSGNTISSNVSHHNEDSGIELVSGSNDNLVVNNVSYANGDHGIDILEATNQRVVSNSVYDNLTAGINAEGGSTATTLANNISVDNGIDSPRTKGNIRVDSTSTLGSTVDYDLVHLRTPGVMLVWGSTSYTSLSAFVTMTSQEANGIEANPLWSAAASGDLRLTAGSPAIDSANSGASGHAAADAEGNARVDTPLTPNTGAGPRGYDDRGAYEFQPQPEPPVAALSVTTDELEVSADASASTDPDGSIESYSFDFGDGSPVVGPQSGAAAGHTYASAGTYTVTVTVKDATGLSSTATSDVTVEDLAPIASLSVTPDSGRAPFEVTLDASASSDPGATPIESYSFDFGDGSPVAGPQSGATATHTYGRIGTYTATVTVTDTAGQSSQDTAEVTVFGENAPPVPALSVTPDSGLVDLEVAADASGSTDPDDGIASYSFDFGDGSPVVGPQSEATANHTYGTAGTYTVTVTVRDLGGGASTATSQVRVEDLPPSASLTVTPESGLAPVGVSADASGSSDVDATPIESYSFDFGDGSPAAGPQSEATATHTYASPGTYTVTVTVADTAGQSAQATAQVIARPNLIGNAGFETGLAGWNTSGGGSGITLTRVSGGRTGDWAAQLANPNSTPTTCTLNDSPNWVRTTSSGTYAVAVWARADKPGAALKLRLREYNGTTLVGSVTTTVTLTTSWQQVTAAYIAVAPGLSTLDYNAYVVGAAPGPCFYADDAVVDLN